MVWNVQTKKLFSSFFMQGGYRLELLDSQERQLLDLTPVTADEDYIKSDPT